MSAVTPTPAAGGAPEAPEQGTTTLQPVLSVPTPGVQTSEFKALVALLVNTVASPILSKHGIATESVVTAADIAFGAAVTVDTAARTILKLFGR